MRCEACWSAHRCQMAGVLGPRAPGSGGLARPGRRRPLRRPPPDHSDRDRLRVQPGGPSIGTTSSRSSIATVVTSAAVCSRSVTARTPDGSVVPAWCRPMCSTSTRLRVRRSRATSPIPLSCPPTPSTASSSRRRCTWCSTSRRAADDRARARTRWSAVDDGAGHLERRQRRMGEHVVLLVHRALGSAHAARDVRRVRCRRQVPRQRVGRRCVPPRSRER